VAVPDGDVQVHPGAGRAEMHVRDLALVDYPRIPVALGPQWDTAFVPATISFDVVWGGPVTRRVNIQDGTNGDRFAGTFAEEQVTVSWSGRTAAGFAFTGDPGDLSTTTIPGFAVAEVGHVRSGIFSPSGDAGAHAGAIDAAFVQALATRSLPGGNVALPPGQLDLALAGPAATGGPWLPLPVGGRTHDGTGGAGRPTPDVTTQGRAVEVGSDATALAFEWLPDAFSQ
jgi:hypothetical protein